jgi:hypothetical protein
MLCTQIYLVVERGCVEVKHWNEEKEEAQNWKKIRDGSNSEEERRR